MGFLVVYCEYIASLSGFIGRSMCALSCENASTSGMPIWVMKNVFDPCFVYSFVGSQTGT